MSQRVGVVVEETPFVVTDSGATLHFHRLWIDENGWVAGVFDEDDEVLRRYPPHRVQRVVEEL